MRTEAGKMPESLIFPIGNEPGVSDDRFGINPMRNPTCTKHQPPNPFLQCAGMNSCGRAITNSKLP